MLVGFTGYYQVQIKGSQVVRHYQVQAVYFCVPGTEYTCVLGTGYYHVPGTGYSCVLGTGYYCVPGTGYTCVLGTGYYCVPGTGYSCVCTGYT